MKVTGMNSIPCHLLNLDAPQYFAFQINTGYTRDERHKQSFKYESISVNLMCSAGVYDTIKPSLTLTTEQLTTPRSRAAMLHYCQRPKSSVLVDIYKKVEAYTP